MNKGWRVPRRELGRANTPTKKNYGKGPAVKRRFRWWITTHRQIGRRERETAPPPRAILFITRNHDGQLVHAHAAQHAAVRVAGRRLYGPAARLLPPRHARPHRGQLGRSLRVGARPDLVAAAPGGSADACVLGREASAQVWFLVQAWRLVPRRLLKVALIRPMEQYSIVYHLISCL